MVADKSNASGSRRRRLRRWLVLAAVLLLALGVDAYQQLHTPLRLAQSINLEIANGERFANVLAALRERGALNSRQTFYLGLYARMNGEARRIKAGEYRLQAGGNSLLMLDQFVAGKILMHQLQLIEGWQFKQAWQAIMSDPDLRHTLSAQASAASIMAAIGHPDVAAEGRFSPDTYRFPRHQSDVDFLRRAYDEMHSRLQTVWAGRAAGLPLKSAYDALIMASLIEKETAQVSERPEIAGVFTRRLQIGMRLQTDPTVIYGMGSAYAGNIRLSDLTHDTPYNTYTRSGLPPTPICLPGQASLEAAVHPATGKALYFVSKGDGSHAFSATLAEHDANVRRYQLEGK